MVLKTFNVEEDVYKEFSSFCKGNGISMSKQIDFFMKSIVEEEPEAKKEYLEKLNRLRKQKTIHIGSLENFRKRYGMK
jgi:antitoxin component of RelBE/YafQ-DinJ toxin-antitoxin module|tara:strand:+ start:1391 stop:1624 length:234 start_codon:yes stop_codon:yes gene_type:complete